MIAKNLVSITALSSKLCTLPIQVELKFATSHNFTGKILEPYTLTNECRMLPLPMLEALCEVQEFIILNFGCLLIIYDAYRPKQVGNIIKRWFEKEPNLKDKYYYPNYTKNELLKLSFIKPYELLNEPIFNEVQVVLGDMDTGNILDMGSPYQFFDNQSNPYANLNTISATAARLRFILRHTMERFGFITDKQVYWRFKFIQQ